MRKQHLDLLAQSSRRPAFPRFGDLTRHITSTFVDRPRYFPGRAIRAAPWFKSAACAVVFARTIKHRRIVIHQGACRSQLLAARADVDIALVVISEVIA